MTRGSAAPAKPIANKRNFFRVPLRLKIEVNAGLPVMLPALLLDISGGGCQIASRLAVETGQNVTYNLKRGEGKPDLRLGGVIRAKRYSGAEHIYFYGVKFEGLKEADHEALLSEITALERRIIMHKRSQSEAKAIPKTVPKQNRGGQARGAYRVAWPFQMTFKVAGTPGVHRATSLDISAGGMRIATDMILRREWILELTFTMPAQVLDVLAHSEAIPISQLFAARSVEQKKVVKQRPFAPITVRCTVVPGVQELRGRYVQGITFKDADHLMKEEITRFVHAAQLSKRRLAV